MPVVYHRQVSAAWYDERVKILIATESYWPNRDGGAVFERALAHGLAGAGHTVRIIAPSATGRPGEETDGDTTIRRVRSFRLPKRIGTFGSRASIRPGSVVAKELESFQPDLIHIHNSFFIGRSTMKHARKLQIPVVATNHNMPQNTLDQLGWVGKLIPNGIERLWSREIGFLNSASFVTSPTQTGLNMLLARGLSAPHRAISNGVDTNRFKPRLDTQHLRQSLHLPKKPIVLYMGRLDKEKRMDVWFDSIPLVRKEIDAHFLVGGRGADLQNLKRRAVSLGVSPHVTFAGGIEDDDLAAFYNLATVFAISSPAELQSIVTLEAMSCGAPVVACDAGALPELCISGRNGYLFLNGDPHTMAKSLIRILHNPGMGEKMGTESRKIIMQKHSVKEMPLHYLEVYAMARGDIALPPEVLE